MTTSQPVQKRVDSVNLPLAGRIVVITRTRAQSNDFVAALENYGARVVSCPTIETADLESYELVDEAIDHLYGYDWLVFTSVNAVDYFLRRLAARGHETIEIDELKVCAIGEATAGRLREAQIHVDLIPTNFKAEGVFLALEAFVGGSESFRGLNFLIPRAVVARDYLPKALEALGARVDVVPVYRTTLPKDLDRGRLTAILAGGADCIAFTSSSTVKNLALLFDLHDLSERLKGIAVACLGEITAATAAEYGLCIDIQPERSTIPALALAIANHFATE